MSKPLQSLLPDLLVLLSLKADIHFAIPWGRRLSQPRCCRKGVQPVFCIDFLDKHYSCPWWHLMLALLTGVLRLVCMLAVVLVLLK